MGHLTREPLTAGDLHRIEFHGGFEWLSTAAFDQSDENPSLPAWLADAAGVLEEAALMLRAQAVSTLRARGLSVREIEKEIGISKSSVDRINQLGAYALTTKDDTLRSLANAVMAKVWDTGLTSGHWEDLAQPAPVPPTAISAELVRGWIRDAGIDAEAMTIEDLTDTYRVSTDDDEDVTVVEHLVVIPDLDDDRRRAVRRLLGRDMGLHLTTLSDAPGTDRWSLQDPYDVS